MPICEICEGKKFKLIANRIREGEGRIARCESCGLVIQDLGWDEEKLRNYYEKEYQTTNSLVLGESQSPEKHFADRMKTIGSVFEKVKPFLRPENRVLEVGCGAGELLSLIKPFVKHCVGVELNTSFVGFIKSRLKIDAYAEDVNKLKLDEKFDLVISISTIDHLPNPLKTLVSMKRFLSPDGRIYVEVPNIDEALNHLLPPSTRAKYNKFFWHRAHLFYFSKDTISALFKKAGLEVGVTCRHEYTLKNFLNWYFLGKPQNDFVTGLTDVGLFSGTSDFEREMNGMFARMEKEFKESIARTFRGDNLCCVGKES